MDIRNILNIIPKEELKNQNTFDGTLESIARVANFAIQKTMTVQQLLTIQYMVKVNQFTKVMLFQITTVMLNGTMYNLNTV